MDILWTKKERTKKTDEKKGAKWALVIFIWGFSAYFLVALSGFIAATVSAKDAKSVWADWQNEYVALLEQRYAADEKLFKGERRGFFLPAPIWRKSSAQKLNEIRYIASHNSYKTGLTPETKYFYHGPLAAIMGKQYDYIFDTITEQLNAGIRSIELDANKVKTADGFRIECLHSDMLETNSTMIDFDKGLKEIRMWMDRNENALPIIVLVEPKGGKKIRPRSL
ncbi:MAG: phosphatidylinositol-specific phospholipase C1-like protein [Clostridiales bacterium]|nr:MAG: phosphatidylinositol-specific phospholipase C1-like protein [Clostridiales bacterium]